MTWEIHGVSCQRFCCHRGQLTETVCSCAQITTDVDSDPRAAYFRQAKNGLYIRMALLKLACEHRVGQ